VREQAPWIKAGGLAEPTRDLPAAGAERVVSERVSSKAPRAQSCLAFLRAGDPVI